jgi:FlaA1/EpsC-like NDP-sugar epimerase
MYIYIHTHISICCEIPLPIMGPPSYMQSIVDQNVIMRHMRGVLSISALYLYIRMYKTVWRFISFKLLCNLLGIILIVYMLMIYNRKFSVTIFLYSLLSCLYTSGASQ